MNNIVLLVLSGLPASGKSGLCKLLKQNENEHKDGTWTCVHIEYDKLLPPEVEQILVLKAEEQITSAWKQYREQITSCVDVLLLHLLKFYHDCTTNIQTEPKPKNVEDKLWDTFVAMVIHDLHTLDKGHEGHGICIVIDDNMYYRSMRYTYYQLARKYEVGFCQVHMQCDVKEACRRNVAREMAVVAGVIEDMANKMEIPDPFKHSWEKYFLIYKPQEEINSIAKLLNEAQIDPVKRVDDIDEESQVYDRIVCSESFIHQADQILRKLISENMAAATKDLNRPKNEIRCLAETLQRKRKQILQELKSGTITVTRDLVGMATDASKDSNSPVFVFVKLLFQSGVT